VLRAFAIAGLSLTLLTACGSQGDGAKSSDPNAGLDTQILNWRTALEEGHDTCATKVEGKGCQDFQVTCKAMQDITPEESAKGVTSKIVSSIRFAARNTDGSTGKSGSAFALFTKTGDAWVRSESPPVNPSTCAPL
jgi:hypothetical protein